MKTVNVVALFLLIIQLSYGQTKKYDFFPLVVGNTWTYEYRKEVRSYPQLYLLFSSRYDVKATFTIESQTMKDDTTTWLVLEQDSGVFHQTSYDYSGNIKSYQVTPVSKTKTFKLVEIMTGKHLLLSGGNGESFWRFPQYWERGIDRRTGPPTYRYGTDSIDIARAFDWLGFKDSVRFRVNTGLIRFRYYTTTGTTMSPVNDFVYASLTDASITVPPQVDSIRQDTTKQDSTTITIPMQFALHPAYPNPFSNTVSFTLDIPEPTEVSLKVLNTLGKEVAVVIDQSLQAGTHIRTWTPSQLSSGIYLCQLRAGPKIFENRILYLK